MSRHQSPPYSAHRQHPVIRGLVTRPQADAERFAVDLRAHGIEPVIAPMLDIAPLSPPPDLAAHLAAAQALLFTSANGVRALAALSSPFEHPALCVGSATAAAAKEAGFLHVESADGTASDLAHLAIQRLNPAAGPVFHAAGTVGSGTLSQTLQQVGFIIQRTPLYQAHIPPFLPDSARHALSQTAQKDRVNMAFFFSPRTAYAFVKLVTEAGLEKTCRDITAYALSRAAAEPLRLFRWQKIVTAGRPDSAALLDRIARPLPRVEATPKKA